MAVPDPAGYVGFGTLEFFQNDISLLTAIARNRWKIDTTTKRLTFYEEDGSTSLLVFNLLDDTQVANAKKIFERVPLCADTTPPTLNPGYSPPAGSLSLASEVSITFSEPVENVTTLTFLVMDANLGVEDNYVLGSVTNPSGNNFVFTPASSFITGRRYQVVLTSGIRDACGNLLVPRAWVWVQGFPA